MVNRELNALEKAFVVRHMFRSERMGDDPEKIRADQDILERIFQCSPWRFAGLKAEHTKRLERRTAQPDLLRKQDVRFVRSLIGLAGSEQERDLFQQEASDILQVDLPAILRISDAVRKGSRVIIEGLDIPIDGDFPFAALDAVPLLKGGAHADYATPLRERVREVWSAAIDQAIPQSMRAKIYGLILPGKRCLDVPHYLKLNVPPKNLIALENGGEVEPRIALAEFSLKARDYNLDYHTEDLSEFLQHFRQRLGFAVLDFTGQMCPKYLDIAANLPLSEKSVVIFNTWARREGKEHQEELRKIWRYMGRPDEKFDLNIARGLCMGLINAGAGRTEDWYFGSTMLEQLPLTKSVGDLAIEHPRRRMERNLDVVIVPMLQRMVELMNSHAFFEGGRLGADVCMDIVGHFNDMFKDVTFGDTHIAHLTKYLYGSEIIGRYNPFHTDIGVIRKPKHLYQGDISRVAEFLMVCARKCLDLLAGEGEEETAAIDRFKCAIMRGNQFVEAGQATKKDRLAYLLDGKVIDYRPVHLFLRAAAEYHTFLLECPDSALNRQMAVTRQEIH